MPASHSQKHGIAQTKALRFEQLGSLLPTRVEVLYTCSITHPSRNQPVVGDPKTENSTRIIPLAEQLITILAPLQANGYVVSGEKPLTFQQQKRSWEKIVDCFHIESYTPHDMRDTCATEWFEMGIPVAVVSKMLGHASIEITMRLYAKVRNKSTNGAREIMDKAYRKAVVCDKQCDNAAAC
jgi:integrase